MSIPDNFTVADYYDEFERDVIGGRFLSKLLPSVVSAVTAQFPDVYRYNGNSPWDDASREDLAQDVVLNQLMGRNQISFVFDPNDSRSTDLAGVRRRLAYVVRRELADRRKALALIEDRLVDRCLKLARKPPFTVLKVGRDTFISIDAALGDDPKPLTEHAISRLAQLEAVQDAPRIPESDGPNQSIGYSSPVLQRVFEKIMDEARIISVSDLRRVFLEIFTSIRPYVLLSFEERDSLVASQTEDLMESKEITEKHALALHSIVSGMAREQCEILLGKFQKLTDAQLGNSLDLSRPTVQKRREEAVALIQPFVAGLDDQDRDRIYSLVMDLIRERLSADEES